MTAQDPIHQTELARWWRERTNSEVEAVVPKAIEYGSTDLYEIGRQIRACMDPKLAEQLTDAQTMELGIYFYVVGKMARWTDAVRRGESVSDDTLYDIGIYVKMAQRVRETGTWPGLDDLPQTTNTREEQA